MWSLTTAPCASQVLSPHQAVGVCVWAAVRILSPACLSPTFYPPPRYGFIVSTLHSAPDLDFVLRRLISSTRRVLPSLPSLTPFPLICSIAETKSAQPSSFSLEAIGKSIFSSFSTQIIK